ncbi:hypothetical protein HAX54_024750, partial [Datura stramonium]|nr:hypothetical protein [Datura stramonium]
EARRWMNLVSRMIYPSRYVSDVTYHRASMVAYILDRVPMPRFSKEDAQQISFLSRFKDDESSETDDENDEATS